MRLPLPDGPCAAASPLQLTLVIEPLTENVFTSFSRNHPFDVCSGDSSDMTVSIDPLFVDELLGEGYEVALTLNPIPVINTNNPESANIVLPAPTTVVFNDDSVANLSHTIMDEFINLPGDYALVRYEMTAIATNPMGSSCTMALPQPPVPFLIRIAPEPVLMVNDQEICS